MVFLHIIDKQSVINDIKFFLKIIRFTMWCSEFLSTERNNQKLMRNVTIGCHCDERKEYKGEIIVSQSLKDYFSNCRVSNFNWEWLMSTYLLVRFKKKLGSQSKIIFPPQFFKLFNGLYFRAFSGLQKNFEV